MTYVEFLISRYRSKGIVVDANLLILLLIGSFDRNSISTFKRTAIYTIEDFDYLMRFLSHFVVLITPNILTEAINLSETYNSQSSFRFFEYVKTFSNSIHEIYVDSKTSMQNPVFTRFGLADSTIAELAEKGYLVLSDDLRLYAYLTNAGKEAINFNHIRTEYLIN